MAVRFHLAPGVRASLARDGRSVLLRHGADSGWWFRNDAAEVRLEPSTSVESQVAVRTLQIVLAGASGPDGYRVRWKLSPVEPPPARAPAAATADILPGEPRA